MRLFSFGRAYFAEIKAFSSVKGWRVTQCDPIGPTIDVFSYQREGRERAVRHRIDQSLPDAARGLYAGSWSPA